jgi:SAM-dependent methyltransferase
MTWQFIRGRLRAVAPRSVVALARRRKLALVRAQNASRSPAEIFGDIYRDNKWGGAQGTFNSGSGSTRTHADVYAGAVRKFVRENGIRRIVDLGCGDFTVGSRLLEPGVEYVGVDIVPELIEHNERRYGSASVGFVCRDIIGDALPDGDLCLVRQVLQHLSNDQIAGVLRNVSRYRYTLVTEHYPALGVTVRPNVDKPCGEDIRVYDSSAVYLDAPPFGCTLSGPILDVEAEHWLVQPGERFRTFLLEGIPR